MAKVWFRTMLAAMALVGAVTARGAIPTGAADAQVRAGRQVDPNWPVDLRWNMRVPMRDGLTLAATVYLPKGGPPAPCIFTLTPYIASTYHDRGMYFAAHGLPFLTVDVRGRGNSDGVFEPNRDLATDGADTVEWMARQPWCTGKVSMWGGSYAGFAQWLTASARPPHLATIVPVASPYVGTDFPVMRGMIDPYERQWLMLAAGRTSQQSIFADPAVWTKLLRERFERGGAGIEGVTAFGVEQPVLRRWYADRENRAALESYNPTPAQLAAIDVPILTITGSYDGDQPGALTFYRKHVASASTEAVARHYLIIGPWDHPGTRTPQASFGGITVGPASLVDLPQLHLDWYRWTMAGGPKPAFLRDRVVYYVIGADVWRSAPTLAAVTASVQTLPLTSSGAAGDVFASGRLGGRALGSDSYLYDPRDTSSAAIDSIGDPYGLTDQRGVLADSGKQLVYTSAPFTRPTEVSGAFRLTVWMAIDQPDTDFEATVYAVMPDCSSVVMAQDRIRARYRNGEDHPEPVVQRKPLLYRFDRFTFTSREMPAGSRLRLVVAPRNSMYAEKNYNSGKPIETETMADARTVRVTLFHDSAHPSTLEVPLGRVR